MTIEISPELESRLKTAAARNGVDTAEHAKRLLEWGLAAAEGRPNQATLDLLAKWEAEDYTDDPEELARRNKEGEEFIEAMNRNRLESEGPEARKIYP